LKWLDYICGKQVWRVQSTGLNKAIDACIVAARQTVQSGRAVKIFEIGNILSADLI
jgi:hypothetical protein